MQKIEPRIQYEVKYVGKDERMIKFGLLRTILVAERQRPLPKKHFFSKQKHETFYDIFLRFQSQDPRQFPGMWKMWLSDIDKTCFFKTWEEVEKFTKENFVETTADDWRNTRLTTEGPMFEPILHTPLGSETVLLLGDTLMDNVYIAVRENGSIVSLAPYFDKDGKICKASRFDPLKYINTKAQEPKEILDM